MSDVKIRYRDALKHWPTAGKTKDKGCGSSAKTLLAEIEVNKGFMTTYDKVIDCVRVLPRDTQRAICCAVGSDYTLDSLVKRSRITNTQAISLSPSQLELLAIIKRDDGDEAAKLWMNQTLTGKKRAHDKRAADRVANAK